MDVRLAYTEYYLNFMRYRLSTACCHIPIATPYRDINFLEVKSVILNSLPVMYVNLRDENADCSHQSPNQGQGGWIAVYYPNADEAGSSKRADRLFCVD